MKNISEIATMCGLDWEIVFRTIIKMNIVPVLEKGRKKIYDQFQQELIIDQLYYLGKLEFLIYESSMNIKEPEPEIIYTDRNDFIKLGYLFQSTGRD